MSKASIDTNIQGWFRDYSRLLAVSFSASARIRHNVTKGESREHQILDALSKLLPTRVSVETNVVIVDGLDAQSPKFDGVLADRTFWPRIFAIDNTTIVMLESVIAAIEVKSTLTTSELRTIFQETAQLRDMQCNPSWKRPLVTIFAYECANPILAFFHFATLCWASPVNSPTLVCILNKSLFGLARFDQDTMITLDGPEAGALPIMYTPGQDSLLVYVYFLSRWAAIGSEAPSLFRQYSSHILDRLEGFYFEGDFLDMVTADKAAFSAAEKCFQRKRNSDIAQLYSTARRTLGLSV